jgi:hypothetical protein
MTKLTDPRAAKVFIVGQNQATEYHVERVGSHDRHLDSLFNRNGESCRGLYEEVTGGRPSRTRPNIEDLTRRLERRGVSEVLETNVICYSTPMSSHLTQQIHTSGRQRGDELFRTLLALIQPPILIVHGAGASKSLGHTFGEVLPPPPQEADDLVVVQLERLKYSPFVFVIPSLAQPAFNVWRSWAPAHLENVAGEVARRLGSLQKSESIRAHRRSLAPELPPESWRPPVP